MNDKFHLMLSYCWADKAVCRQIFERLCTEGYRVWFDEKNMHGNTITAMADAIANSQCIVICMSENYERSNPCHHEAEFAYTQQRHIVPLIVQSKYKPKALWLGFIIGSRLYVNFTKYEFNKAFGMLEAEIKTTAPVTAAGENHVESKKRDDTSKDPPVDSTEKKQVSTVHETKRVEEWTSDDVISWCQAQHLLTFARLLEHYDGAGLLRLYEMAKTQSDNEIFRLLQEDCQLLGNKGEIKLTLTEFVRFQTELNRRMQRDAPQTKTMPAKETKSTGICLLL